MSFFKYLVAIAAVAAIVASSAGAKTKKGQRYLEDGRKAQLAEDWDLALELYQKALSEDPSDPLYMAAYRRMQFESSQSHLKTGKELRADGKLPEALLEFQRAFAIDPSSTIAQQELRTTHRMVEREAKKAKEAKEGQGQAQGPPSEEERGLTPAEAARRDLENRIGRLEALPELRPISPRLNTLKMSGQPVKVLFETVGKLAGINVIFDAEFQAPPRTYSVDLTNATLEEALRYLSMLTRTYWKPLSTNTIFVTEDNPTKRRDHEEMVVRVFYLQNVTKVQDLQEIATAVRSVTDIRRFFTYNGQNALLVRGTADQMSLAEKLIGDLDKPLAEVVVDVIVLEALRAKTRTLAASILDAAGTVGLSLPIVFTPGGQAPPATDDGDGNGGGSPTPPQGSMIPLAAIGSLGSKDWSTTMPGALLQAVMSDRSTRVLQRPQVRAADGQKASLRLGDKFPYATGSFQPGVGAVGVSPLVSTQFQFADVGVNVDMTPKIHGAEDVSMHVEIEISAVRDRIDIGGLEQPVIGQRKVIEDIRVRDGEVTLLGGLTEDQKTHSKSGVPGLGQIPVLKWLGFNSESTDSNEREMLIAIIPHIVRRPDVDEVNLRGIAAGTEQVVRVNRAPNGGAEPAPPAPAAPAAEPPKPEAAPAPPAEAPKETPPPPAPAAPFGVRFDPPALKVKQGENVTVSLVVENGVDVFNAPIRFQFDPKILRLNELQRGNFLTGDGQQVIFTRNILNDTGYAIVILNRLPGATGVSGSGPLVSVTFQAIARGTTQLTVPEVTIRDSKMQLLPAPPPSLPIEVQ